MKSFTVLVPDNKVQFFKDLLDNLHFKAKENEQTYELNDAHKTILNERLENYKNNPDSYIDWEDVQKDIEKTL